MHLQPVTPEEAYEQLHDALNAVRKKHSTDFFAGPNFAENTLKTARRVLSSLQIALLMKTDGITPDPKKVLILSVPMTPETLERIKRIGPSVGETEPELIAAMIITTWLDRNR